ncbi:MAG: hypothetical protein WBQ17_12655 [Rhizomicrobium sp.]
MRKLNIVLVSAATVLLAAPCWAQTSQAMNPAPNSAYDSRTSMSQPNNDTVNAPNDPSLNEVVCKNEPPPTGTRIGGERVCKTNREWLADEDARNRQRGINGNTDFSHGGGSGLGGSTAGMGH